MPVLAPTASAEQGRNDEEEGEEDEVFALQEGHRPDPDLLGDVLHHGGAFRSALDGEVAHHRGEQA